MSTNNLELMEISPLRNLKFRHIWALGVGAVIGDGIFLLMGEGIAIAGPSAVFAYLLAGLSQLFIVIALSELAVGMPSAGAMSEWVKRFMGSWWGFLAGFTSAAGWIIAGGSVGLALGTITMWFFPQLDGAMWPIVFSVIFISIFAILNMLGSVIAARVQLYMVLALVGVMALFGIIGLKEIDVANFAPLFPFGMSGFWAAVPLGTYAYLGAVTLATAGGEVENPRDLPRALIWSSVTFLVLYSLAQIVLLGIIPWEQISMASSPFTEAAGHVFGFAGAFIMNLAAWIAAATCIIMGTLYASSRILYAQGREGLLPAFFGYLHPKTRTPVYGILFIWACSVGLVLIGSVNPDLVYVELSYQLVLAWMVSWSLAIVAAILYRKNHIDEVNQLSWKQPLYPLFPILAFIGIAIVFFGTFLGSWMILVRGAIWMGALYIVFKYYRNKNKVNKDNSATTSV